MDRLERPAGSTKPSQANRLNWRTSRRLCHEQELHAANFAPRAVLQIAQIIEIIQFGFDKQLNESKRKVVCDKVVADSCWRPSMLKMAMMIWY